jgi:hypothetical protein
MEEKEELREYIRFLYAQLQEEKGHSKVLCARLDEAKKELRVLRNFLKSESQKYKEYLQTIDRLMTPSIGVQPGFKYTINNRVRIL